MSEIVSGTDSAPQEPRAHHDAICLRCDWTGETDGEACPRCEAPVYRLGASTKRPEVDPSDLQLSSAERVPSSTLEVPQEEDHVRSAVPVVLGRRTWLIVGAVTAATLGIVATGGPFDRHQAPPASAATSSAARPSVSSAASPSAAGRKSLARVEVVGDITSAPVPSPDGNRIVFGARGGTLYLMDLRRDRRSLIVHLPGAYLDSVDDIEWSPDGAHLAVMNDLIPGRGRLYVVNTDGSGVRVVIDNYEPGGLAWSPDGSKLAFVDSTKGSRGWYVVSADGTSPPREIDESTYVSWRDPSGS